MAAERPPTASPLTLWYEQPATRFYQSLPLGNGRLGGMVFGGVAQERIELNEISLWSGSRQDADRPDAYQHLAEIQRLLKEGKNPEAQDLVMRYFTCRGPGSGQGSGASVAYGCYQTLGTLKLEVLRRPTPGVPLARLVETNVLHYRRQLDLAQAIASVEYEAADVTYRREYFMSAPDQALIVRLTASQPGALNFDATLDRPERFRTQAVSTSALLMTGQLTNGVNGGGMKYAARLRAATKSGAVSTSADRLQVRNATEVLLLLTAATDYRGFAGRQSDDPVRASADDLQRAARKSWTALRRAHLADYQRLFNRVSLALEDGSAASAAAARLPTDRRLVTLTPGGTDPALMALYFQFGRYLLISSSRPGGLPANLQGLWAEEIQTPWNGDYHVDINVQMNYWPVEVGNLSELHQPLFKLIESLQEPGAHTAQAYYHARGWVVHVITNPWDYTSPGEHASWGATVSGSAWLCQHLWEHYAFTGDRAYLAWAYPILKGAALFYLDLLIQEPKHGWLVTAPSNSPENAFRLPDGRVAQVCMGPTIDEQLLRNLFGHCLAAARILGLDPDFQRELADKRSRLAPDQIGSQGQILEWLEEYPEPEPHHRHLSPLWGLFPGDEISLDHTPDLARAARVLLERRGDAGTGWSLAWKINLWARLGEGNRAYKLLRALLNPTGSMGFAYDGGGSGTYANLFCAHPPFQIDGDFGGCAGIAELLLQSRADESEPSDLRFEMKLLPALPAAWPVGHVHGLRARGGFTVDLDWNQGILRQATVQSDNDQPCSVCCRDQALGVTDGAGHTVRTEVVGPFFRFLTKKGVSYRVEPLRR